LAVWRWLAVRALVTGEEITIATKKASVDVKARVLTAKNAVPSVQKAKRRLEG